MAYHVDRASVYQNIILLIGWSSEILEIEVICGGEILPIIFRQYYRADLFEGARGFSMCAIAPESIVIHEEIVVKINSRVRRIHEFTQPSDSNGGALLSEFKSMTDRSPGFFLEIGSRARSGNSYRELFANAAGYVGIDIANGPGVEVVCDAHHMSESLEQNFFDYVFSVSVFEHLLMPWMVALEMNKVMKTGAIGYIQSHQGWPLHEEPWDFWRFSSNAWRGLFNKITGFEVIKSGYDLGATIIPKFALGGPLQNIERHTSYLLSACIVKKISNPTVRWDARAEQVYNLAYDH